MVLACSLVGLLAWFEVLGSWFEVGATWVQVGSGLVGVGGGPRNKNYTKKFRGMVTLTDALAGSLNIPAVRVSEAIGRNNVRRIAIDFGITSTFISGNNSSITLLKYLLSLANT